jgi:hypothetical protein
LRVKLPDLGRAQPKLIRWELSNGSVPSILCIAPHLGLALNRNKTGTRRLVGVR